MRVGLELTSRCNLACVMCGHASMTRPRADMPWGRFTRIVDEIAQYGHVLASLHWYGEPLLAERFLDAIDYLARSGVGLSHAFYTNATLLTPAMTDAMLAAGFLKVCAHTKKVWLGLDSMDPATYAAIRCGGDFDTTVANVEYFCRRVKLRGVAVQRMLTRLNPGEPIKPFRRFGVPVKTRCVGRHWDKSRDLTVNPFVDDRRQKCRELGGTLYIAQDGRACGCCIDGDCEQAIGNVDDLRIVALSKLRDAQVSALAGGDYSKLPLCARCTGSEAGGR